MIAYVFHFDIPKRRFLGLATNELYSKILKIDQASKNLDNFIPKIIDFNNQLIVKRELSSPGGYLVDFGSHKLNQKNALMSIFDYCNKLYIAECTQSPLGLGNNPYHFITTIDEFTKFWPLVNFNVHLLSSQNTVFYYDTFTEYLSVCFGCFLDLDPMDFDYTLSKYKCNVGYVEFKECFNTLTDYTKFILENQQ
jgi:hypothetical protein